MPRFPLPGRSVYVAGHRGMVGSALVRRLAGEGCRVLTADRRDVDLTRQADVEAFLERTRPDAVVIAAAKVGGILANDTYPADFLRDNLGIELNLIAGAHRAGVQKLVLLGSSCIYPRLAPQPMREESLLTGPLEPTNQWYAMAKLAGVMLCQAYRRQHGADFVSCLPTNLYGPGDNFDLSASHVVPALMRKMHEAKTRGERQVTVWGSGTPLRELLHVDDCADAVVKLLVDYSGEQAVNVGSGEELSIRAIAEAVAHAVGADVELVFDRSKPDGTPRKLLDTSRLAALGWRPRIPLARGLAETYAWYLENVTTARR